MKSTIIITALTVFFCIVNSEPIGKLSIQSHASHFTPKSRLSGGYEVEPHSAPYVVYLEVYLTNLESGTRICAGTLISRNYILTSKRCLIDASSVKVYLGVHNIVQTNDTCREERSANIYHKQYRYDSTTDLTAIKLNKPVDKKPGCIDYVKLPKWSDSKDIYRYKFQYGEIYGWGAHSTEDGNKTSPVLYRVSEVLIKGAESDFLWVDGFALVSRSTCIGDGGAPLMHAGVQVGVAWNSRLELCEDMSKMYSNFAAVAQCLKWIQDNSDVHIEN